MFDTLLGLNRRASLENPSFDLSDVDAVNSMLDGGFESGTGEYITASKALKIPPLWQAIALISGSISIMPLDLYERKSKGRDVAGNHPAYMLCRRQANDEQTASQFWRQFMVSALLWNNAYAYIDRSASGRPLGLYNLLPDRTQMERRNGKLYCVTETNGRLIPIPHENVLHISNGISLDGVNGLRTLQAGRDSIGVTLALQKFVSKFFKSGVRVGGVLELPLAMGKKSQDGLVEGFRKMHENVEQWFKVAILRDGAKFHQQAVAPENAQMDESREQQAREVARLFNLMPSKLGLSDSVSYNSKEEDNQAYLTDTLMPWLILIVDQCWMKLLALSEREADSHYFEHNAAVLLRMNTLKRMQSYAIGVRNRFFNPNEVRAMENLPPYEGGDEYMGDGKAPQPGSSDGGADTDTTGNTDDKGNPPATEDEGKKRHAKRRVIFNLGSQARQKSGKPKAFVEWIDGGLASHRQLSRELLGDEELVERVLKGLQEVAARASGAELPGAVDDLVTKFEMEV